MDTNKETRENTLKSEENSSGVSEVRMPLVDALRKYFQKTLIAVDVFVDGKKEGQILAEADTSSWIGVYGTNG